MLRTTLHLPVYRLELKLIRRRKGDIDPLFPSLKTISATKKGSKVSRYFRHIFEHKAIKKLFGANIALAIMASTLLPAQANFTPTEQENFVAQTAVVLTTQKGIQYPVAQVKVNQGYRFYHPGIDLEGVTGDPVRAAMPGVVLEVNYSRFGYGNHVILSHGSEITTLYAHLSKILVTKGQIVDMSTVIGKVGSTGRSTGDHLHFEVRDAGRAINPFSVLPR